MSKIISVATQKGGVGKTTTTCGLAAALKHKGYKVLVVDMDPQSNLSFSMGADTESATIYNVLKGEVKTQFAIQRSTVVDTIATNILLSGIELEFTSTGREFLLAKVLEPIADIYDYIIIDSPPGLGILTVNALAASNYVILPMMSDIFSLQGITQIYETVEHLKRTCNSKLEIAGILLTRFNPRTKLAKEVLGTAELVSQSLNIPIFKTYIRSCISLSEAQALQCDMFEYARYSTGVLDYESLLSELKERGI
ncbi:MAG: ParA family protein [Angelakisella sp.]|nr:ParA family protein [Angelakisella sp.]